MWMPCVVFQSERLECRLYGEPFDHQQRIYGLDLLDGKGADKNESTVTGLPLLPLDQKATIVVSVRKSGVLVRVDGRTVIDWKGDSARLGLHRNLEVPRKGFFIATWDSRFLIHRATLVRVDGR